MKPCLSEFTQSLVYCSSNQKQDERSQSTLAAVEPLVCLLTYVQLCSCDWCLSVVCKQHIIRTCRVCKHQFSTIPSVIVFQTSSHEIKLYSVFTSGLLWFHISFTLAECPAESSPLSTTPVNGSQLYLTVSSPLICKLADCCIVCRGKAARRLNDCLSKLWVWWLKQAELGPRASWVINRLFSMLIALVTLEIIAAIKSSELLPPLCTWWPP